MGSKVNTVVKNNFNFYQELKLGGKTYNVNPIEIDEIKQSHVKTKTKSVPAKHITLSNDLIFCVEVDKVDSQNFKFKLFCNQVYSQPFFRFDSDGLAHKNSDPAIPLEEQQVTTPHFHAFNDKGVEYAYKTEHLTDENETKALLDDISFAASHFCSEANLELEDGGTPFIITTPGELPFLKVSQVDPLSNVNFN